MSFFKTVEDRKCCRRWASADVPAKVVESAIAYAQLAPSAGNLEAFEVVAVRNTSSRNALAHACVDQEFVGEAPLVLVFLADPSRSAKKYGSRGATLYAVQDATIAASYTQLALTAQGYSSCWVGAFDETVVAAIVGAPLVDSSKHPSLGFRPVVVMPVGVAAEIGGRSRRRPLASILHAEQLDVASAAYH